MDKFLSLIPFLVSDGDIELIEVDWGRGLDDVPPTSKLRVLTGVVFNLLHCTFSVIICIMKIQFVPFFGTTLHAFPVVSSLPKITSFLSSACRMEV